MSFLRLCSSFSELPTSLPLHFTFFLVPSPAIPVPSNAPSVLFFHPASPLSSSCSLAPLARNRPPLHVPVAVASLCVPGAFSNSSLCSSRSLCPPLCCLLLPLPPALPSLLPQPFPLPPSRPAWLAASFASCLILPVLSGRGALPPLPRSDQCPGHSLSDVARREML